MRLSHQIEYINEGDSLKNYIPWSNSLVYKENYFNK